MPPYGSPLAVVTAALLGGCAGLEPLSDPAPDPEVQPIEVVVNSDSRPQTPCLLNVDEVRAGNHEVRIVGVSGYARVDIVDEDGRLVFGTDNAGQRIETNGAGEVTSIHGGDGEGSGSPARLGPGTYTVQCRPKNGAPGQATLRGLPARAGHKAPRVVA